MIGSQTTEAYSNEGQTNARWADSLTLGEHLLRLCIKKFRVLFALAAVLFICEDHDSLLFSVTPR